MSRKVDGTILLQKGEGSSFFLFPPWRSMEITLNRKSLTAIAIPALIIAGFAAWLFALGGLPLILSAFAGQAPAASTTTDPDARAAALGISTLYTVSAAEGVDAWLERVCAISTEAGCEFTQTAYKPGFSRIMQGGVETAAYAQPIERMEGNGTYSVWKLSLTVDNPWAGLENPTIVYALVYQEGDAWLFGRVLFEQEVEARYAAAKE